MFELTTLDINLIVTTFIATLPTLITSVGGLIYVLRKIEVVHVATNSMKDALVKKTEIASTATGHAQGVKDEQHRVSNLGSKQKRNSRKGSVKE